MIKIFKMFQDDSFKINYIYIERLITLRYAIKCMTLSYKKFVYIQNVPHATYRNINRHPRKGKILLIFHPWPAIY